jgi:hypothetical protein
LANSLTLSENEITCLDVNGQMNNQLSTNNMIFWLKIAFKILYFLTTWETLNLLLLVIALPVTLRYRNYDKKIVTY